MTKTEKTAPEAIAEAEIDRVHGGFNLNFFENKSKAASQSLLSASGTVAGGGQQGVTPAQTPAPAEPKPYRYNPARHDALMGSVRTMMLG